MRAASNTDVGRLSDLNEDRVFLDPGLGLIMLADGMGGHLGGEVASDLALSMITAVLKGDLLCMNSDASPDEISSLLIRAIKRANEQILARVSQDPNLKGMGTTVVLALERNGDLYIAHIGDSRAYLMQNGVLRQLTRDHSLVAEMLNAGEISPRELRNHHLRNYLTRSLGQQNPQAEVQTTSWDHGDYLLLCSDGLTTMIDDREIETLLTRYSADLGRVCRELIDAANSRGGKDNITVALASPE